MGFEPTAFCLGSKRSTTELHPQRKLIMTICFGLVYGDRTNLYEGDLFGIFAVALNCEGAGHHLAILADWQVLVGEFVLAPFSRINV